MARMSTALLEIKKYQTIQSNEIQAVLGVWFWRNTTRMGNTVSFCTSKMGANCGIIAKLISCDVLAQTAKRWVSESVVPRLINLFQQQCHIRFLVTVHVNGKHAWRKQNLTLPRYKSNSIFTTEDNPSPSQGAVILECEKKLTKHDWVVSSFCRLYYRNISH